MIESDQVPICLKGWKIGQHVVTNLSDLEILEGSWSLLCDRYSMLVSSSGCLNLRWFTCKGMYPENLKIHVFTVPCQSLLGKMGRKRKIQIFFLSFL